MQLTSPEKNSPTKATTFLHPQISSRESPIHCASQLSSLRSSSQHFWHRSPLHKPPPSKRPSWTPLPANLSPTPQSPSMARFCPSTPVAVTPCQPMPNALWRGHQATVRRPSPSRISQEATATLRLLRLPSRPSTCLSTASLQASSETRPSTLSTVAEPTPS
jgi:hypothetical protein